MSRSLASFIAPIGRKVSDGLDDEGHLGTMSTLSEATDERIKVASRHFVEAKAKDFEIVGKSYVDRATGQHYRPGLTRFSATLPPKVA